MEKIFDLTDKGDSERKLYAVDGAKERIITYANNDDVLQSNYEDRKTDGFDIGHHIRRVARIDMNTVRLLAYEKKDKDAAAYLEYHDTAARDRMIERYPILFKACSGGI
ncbi:hypothetical protein [Pectinatus frisingensis]|uniref:hypothetical protein n=1 Tax=Pectinatus frisingensis TaxID=865 RepID=UPI0018C63762|nr:hypothetical protein [Pectinatus frisingensis]